MKIWLPLMFFLLLSSCGPQSQNGNGCTPNVIDNMQLLVTSLGSNTYKFQVCTAVNTSNSITVYGASSVTNLDPGFNGSGSYRGTPHISDGTSVGSIFQVTFYPSDNAFAIYEDNGGNFDTSSSAALVHSRLFPQ